MGQHTARVQWQRGGQDFLDNRYSRAHLWCFDGGAQIEASPSPQIVPEPMSVAALVDPEEAFVASLSSCHMLFFLSFAAKAGIVIDEYSDDAIGILGTNEHGRKALTEVSLHPQLKLGTGRQPARSELRALHERAHANCFLANSVNFPVLIELE